MKTIMPMARPATVSVSQVEGLPIAGSAASASSGTRAMGFQSMSLRKFIGALPGSGRAVCFAAIRPRRVRPWPLCTTRPSSITATLSPSCLAKLKFCSTSRMVVCAALSSRKAAIMFWMIAGARPLLGSSISSSLRGSTMARETASICFCPPLSLPAGWFQNFFMAGNRPKIHSSRVGVDVVQRCARRARPAACFRFTAQVGEDAHALGHVGHAAGGDLGRLARGDVLPGQRDPCPGWRATGP